MALALRQNPRLTAVAREITAAESGLRSARAPANPTLLFTPGITPAGSDEEALFQQPLEINGTRQARTGVARAGLRRTAAEATIELRSVVFETKAAYFELARAQELRSLARDVLRSAEEFDRLVRRQVELGGRAGIDQTQTGLEVARTRQQLTQAESGVTVALAALNTLMGRPPAEPVGPLAPLAFTPETTDEATLYRQALTSRAEIESSEASRESFRQEARLARAEGRPDLAPQFRAGGITRGVRDTGFGVGITLPFLDWGSRRQRVRQAEASALAQEARTASTRNLVRQEVGQALARLRAAETVIQSYQTGVLDQARRLVEASRQGFLIGAPGTSLLTVIEAQRTYRAVQTEYTNALAQHAEARAELERAAGAVPASTLPATAAVADVTEARNPR